MQQQRVFIAVLTVTSALTAWAPVQADVIRRQFSEDNFMVKVSNDTWQPENFENGTTVPATYVKQAGITLDGKDNEPGWSTAMEVVVPLSYGNVGEASVKVLYTDEEVFIRVRWADATEDRDQHPWVWDPDQEQFVTGPQVEDSLMLSFEAGCEWVPSLLAGYSYDFDAWHWLAARSDPVGQAWDLIGSTWDGSRPNFEHTAYESRNSARNWNVKFEDYTGQLSHESWDELNRSYNFRTAIPIIYYRAELDRLRITDASEQLPAPLSPPANETETFPQFKAVKLTEDAGEVGAKGHWEDGYWTVELRRILETPSEIVTDTVFNRLTQFSIHVFDHAERIDQSSESGRLFLRFLPSEQMLVKD